MSKPLLKSTKKNKIKYEVKLYRKQSQKLFFYILFNNICIGIKHFFVEKEIYYFIAFIFYFELSS